MGENTRTHYDKRQVIPLQSVPPEEFIENILLCIPAFAWRVARAYLSEQAHWRTTYAVSYDDNGHTYEIPSPAEMDIISEIIDKALSEVDMSCNIVEALEGLQQTLQALVDKECPSVCGGDGGSAGAGATPQEPVDWVDTGENFPEGFESREEYDEYKCLIASHIINVIKTDIEWLQNLPVGEYIASVIIATLLTPIVGDEVIALVGGLIFLALEGTANIIYQEIIDALNDYADELRCAIYNALDASDAYNSVQTWIGDHLEGMAAWVAERFMGQDIVNWAYRNVHAIIDQYSADCSDCGNYAEGVYDFALQDWSWIPDQTRSVNDGEWREGVTPAPEHYWGQEPLSGSGTAFLRIYHPDKVSVDEITVWHRATTEEMDYLRIYTSDDAETWTAVASATNITSNWITPRTFTDLGIIDQYVAVDCQKYWAGANCAISKITFDVPLE